MIIKYILLFNWTYKAYKLYRTGEISIYDLANDFTLNVKMLEK